MHACMFEMIVSVYMCAYLYMYVYVSSEYKCMYWNSVYVWSSILAVCVHVCV